MAGWGDQPRFVRVIEYVCLYSPVSVYLSVHLGVSVCLGRQDWGAKRGQRFAYMFLINPFLSHSKVPTLGRWGRTGKWSGVARWDTGIWQIIVGVYAQESKGLRDLRHQRLVSYKAGDCLDQMCVWL